MSHCEVHFLVCMANVCLTSRKAFESVVPSERTQITATHNDCLLRLAPPTKASSLLVSLDHVNISTDLAGDSDEKDVDVTIVELSTFLADEADSQPGDAPSSEVKGPAKWMVSCECS